MPLSIILDFASVFALSASFECAQLWPLAFISLVPLFLRITVCDVRIESYLELLVLGFAFYAWNLWWLIEVHLPGWWLGCSYLALQLPIFCALARFLVTRARWPSVIALPVAWTTSEILKSAFPWLNLGYAVAPSTHVIQIADLAGASGASFLVAFINGLISQLLLMASTRSTTRRLALPLLALAGVVAFVYGYGSFRVNQQSVAVGPRIGIVQEHVSPVEKEQHSVEAYSTLIERHLKLTSQAIALSPEQIDLIIWPETAVPVPLNPEWTQADLVGIGVHWRSDEVSWKILQELSRSTLERIRKAAVQANSHLLVGYYAIFPDEDYSRSVKENAVALVPPRQNEPTSSQSKTNLVPLGEYAPARSIRWLHSAFKWMSMDSVREGLEATPGAVRYPFEMNYRGNAARLGCLICFEETTAGPGRRLVYGEEKGKSCDFLVMIVNDAAFAEQEMRQRLRMAQIRAVELRVPIVRCVNGGYSGIVDSNGRVQVLADQDGGFRRRTTIADGVWVDSRSSFFGRSGPWVDWLCLVAVFLAVGWFLAAELAKRRRRKTREDS